MKRSNLTGKMMRESRDRLGWVQTQMADALGVCIASLRSYETEKRSDKDKPVPIPKLVDWALAAITSGLRPYSEGINKKGK